MTDQHADPDREWDEAWWMLTGRREPWGGCAEREAVYAMRDRLAAHDAQALEDAARDNAALREQIEDMVPATWAGLLSILEQHYPTDIFPVGDDNPNSDSGPRILSLIRHLDARAAQVAQAREEIEKGQAYTAHRTLSDPDPSALLAAVRAKAINEHGRAHVVATMRRLGYYPPVIDDIDKMLRDNPYEVKS